MNHKDLQTNAPKEKTMGVTSDLNTKNLEKTERLYPGDSVNEHKRLEIANMFLSNKELGQQNNNL